MDRKGVMKQKTETEEYVPGLVIIIVMLAAAFLRVFLLPAKGMWLDETFSVWIASHSVADLLQWVVRIDQHPPLYYLLLHYWINLNGDGAYSVRMLSALFGIATIPVIYWIGKRISGGMVGLMAAVFLAVSLFNIYFAQETRMYTLLTFNAAAAMYALVRLLTDSRSLRPVGSQFREYLHAWWAPAAVEPDPQAEFSYKDLVRQSSGWRARIFDWRWPDIHIVETDLAWVAWIVFSAATLFSHNTAVFFVLATNIFVFGLIFFQKIKKSGTPPAFQAPSLGNWVKAQIGILLLWSPWIGAFIKQASAVDQRFWIPAPTWDGVLRVLKSFLNPSVPLPDDQAIVVWILYGLVLVLGLVYFRKKLSQFLFLAALLVIPFLGELLVSIRRPIFYDRTLIWTTIPLYLILAAGVAQFKFRPLMFLVLGSLATVGLFSTADYYRFYEKEDWSSPAGYVGYYAEKGDLILFNSNFVEIPFNYYFRKYENAYDLKVEKQGLPLDLFDQGVLEPEMTANDIPALIASVSGHKHVWLVYSHNSYTDPNGLIPQTLGAEMKLVQTRDFYGGQVQLYEAR
jgi:hypothetical protein